jgi:hypothetical protein
MTALHDEALTAEARTALEQLGPVADRLGFHLGGGAAVAAHLAHRRAAGFDFVSPAPELDPHALAADLRAAGVALAVRDIAGDALRGSVAEVPVGFVRYRYAPLEEPVPWPDFGCAVASLEDLACSELAAAVQRGARKDFDDVLAICTRAIPLAEALQLYQRKFEIDDVGHVLMGLTYFDEADDQPDPDLLDSPTWDQVRAMLNRWVKKLTR